MSLTQQQANEIRRHLIRQLNANGFGIVADEANIALFEEESDEKLAYSADERLQAFIKNVIYSLNTFSNSYLPRAIDRIKNNVENTEELDSIFVEPDQGIDEAPENLNSLPRYDELIASLNTLLTEIQNDNDDIRTSQ